MANREDTIQIVRKADAFCFDVDSTLIQVEGIDELAQYCGKGLQIAEMTTKAMSGCIIFEEAFQRRLDILQLKRKQLQDFIATRLPPLTPHVENLICLLQQKMIPIYLISGGLKCVIEPIAQRLHIPIDRVYANRLKFDLNGDYAGYDHDQPTARSGGKAIVINELKQRFNYSNLVLIGDGATDLEACPPADAFIGFGGNVIRPNVQNAAKWFITDFQDVIDVLGSS